MTTPFFEEWGRGIGVGARMRFAILRSRHAGSQSRGDSDCSFDPDPDPDPDFFFHVFGNIRGRDTGSITLLDKKLPGYEAPSHRMVIFSGLGHDQACGTKG